MRVLAAGSNLPTNVSQKDPVQMISGKLTNDGWQPSNIQLVVGDRQLRLCDKDGTFLTLASEDTNKEPHLEVEGSEEASQPSEAPTREELERVTAKRDELQTQLAEQQGEVQCQKEHYAQLQRLNCEQLEEFDKKFEDKEDQIKSLLEKIKQLEAVTHHSAMTFLQATAPTTTLTPSARTPAMNVARRGKAPPVDQFSGDQPDLTFNDWLPTLERAAQWNAWRQGSCCSLWGTYGRELSISGISSVRMITTATPKQ